MTIGQRIKLKRMELGISQRELAKRLGYDSHTTLTGIESGKFDVTQSKVALFAEVLNTTPAYLMGWEDEEKPVDQKTDGLRGAGYYELNDENRAVIDSLIEKLLKSQSGE
ncbi:MAG: helix-turn-helix transcriptional regulator [Clostridia bacterium]|nr:helix-turn-helix transcriptional regulator [Clostridia bacterium]